MSWVGAAIGIGTALLGGGSQQSGTTNQTTTSSPWEGVQPYLKDLFAKAQTQQQGGGYQGQFIAPQSPFTTQAIAQQAAQAQNPNGLVGQAQGQLGQTIGGDYLDPSSNPYLQSTLNSLTGNALRATNQQFSGDNFGSSANQQWLSKNIVDATAPYLSNLYSGERTNQLNALNLAPSLQGANTSQLAGAGAMQDQYAQAKIAAAQQQAQQPFNLLSQYQQLVSGQPGGSSTTATPYYTNPAANILGGGLAGYQLGSQIGGAFQSPTQFGQSSNWNSAYNGTGTGMTTGFGLM